MKKEVKVNLGNSEIEKSIQNTLIFQKEESNNTNIINEENKEKSNLNNKTNLNISNKKKEKKKQTI